MASKQNIFFKVSSREIKSNTVICMFFALLKKISSHAWKPIKQVALGTPKWIISLYLGLVRNFLEYLKGPNTHPDCFLDRHQKCTAADSAKKCLKTPPLQLLTKATYGQQSTRGKAGLIEVPCEGSALVGMEESRFQETLVVRGVSSPCWTQSIVQSTEIPEDQLLCSPSFSSDEGSFCRVVRVVVTMSEGLRMSCQGLRVAT